MEGREDVYLGASTISMLSHKIDQEMYDFGSIPQYHMIRHAHRLVSFNLCPEVASRGVSLNACQDHS